MYREIGTAPVEAPQIGHDAPNRTNAIRADERLQIWHTLIKSANGPGGGFAERRTPANAGRGVTCQFTCTAAVTATTISK